MSVFLRLESAIISGSRVIALTGLAGLLTLAFATVVDVLMRWLFNMPITGVRDASSLFVAIVIAASLPYCMAQGSNITIRFLGRALGRPWHVSLDIFGNLVTLVTLGAMSWKFWLYAKDLALANETTWVLGWPVAPWWRCVAIILAFCVPIEVIVILRFFKPAVHDKGSNQKGVNQIKP